LYHIAKSLACFDPIGLLRNQRESTLDYPNLLVALLFALGVAALNDLSLVASVTQEFLADRQVGVHLVLGSQGNYLTIANRYTRSLFLRFNNPLFVLRSAAKRYLTSMTSWITVWYCT
jgi:hypothetical protein